MARIEGVDLPKNKKIKIALQTIYGIGKSRAIKVLSETEVSPEKKVADLTDDEVAKLREQIDDNYKVEGALKTELRNNIKRLIDISSYRGARHKKGLPARGQRTKTNARTRKGRKKR